MRSSADVEPSPVIARTVNWTEFPDRSGHTSKECTGTLADLYRRLGEVQAREKRLLPLLKLATFGAAPSEKGSLRHDANVVMITGVEGDYDGEAVQADDALARLERAGISAVVVTTPSHTPEKPRWRVYAPLSRPMGRAGHYRMVARLNGALGGILAGESFTLSQAFYFGRVEGVPFETHATFDGQDGACIDLLDELDEIAIGKKMRNRVDPDTGEITTSATVEAQTFATAVRDRGRKLRTGDGRRDMLKSFAGHLSRDCRSAQEIKGDMRAVARDHFDDADPVDWKDIDTMVSAIVSKDEELRYMGESLANPIMESARRKAETSRQAAILTPLDQIPPLEPPPSLVVPDPGARRLRPLASNFASLSPVRWVLQDFIAAGEVVTFAGQPGVGKSTVFAGLALLVAGFGAKLGSDIVNDRPRQVAVASENPAQYERIIHALCVGHGLNPDAVGQVVHLYDTARMRLTEIDREISVIIEERRSAEPPLLILDTASASFELESENDNSQVGAALAKLRPLAGSSGAGIWIVAHAAKAVSREDSDITPRGAGAWAGDVHGTGSVFREKDRPDTVFLRSLKNRWERGYDEIAVVTRVTLHEVVDDRGLIQQLRIRTGVPCRADSNQQQRQDQRRAAEQSAQSRRACQWVLSTLHANPDAPTTQRWLEDAAKGAHDIPRSAVRDALETLRRDGQISLKPIDPRPKNGARERFVLGPSDSLAL